MLKRYIKYSFATLVCLGLFLAHEGYSQESGEPSGVDSPYGLDWNSDNIKWLDYEAGVQQSKASGKPLLLIFFADWCAVCHSYEAVFQDEEITRLTRNWVMARSNVVDEPELNDVFSQDGYYTPRTFALGVGGIQLNIVSDHPHYKYFYPGTIEQFRQLLNQWTRNGQEI